MSLCQILAKFNKNIKCVSDRVTVLETEGDHGVEQIQQDVVVLQERVTVLETEGDHGVDQLQQDFGDLNNRVTVLENEPDPGSGGADVADPVGEITLTVENGTATTALRSDGRHPLSQAIAPIWTGIHNWGSGLARMVSPWISTSILDSAGGVLMEVSTTLIKIVKPVKPELAIITTSTVSLTLNQTHAGTVLIVTSNFDRTVTLPAIDTVPVGYNVMIVQGGVAFVTFAANGNTINSFSNKTRLAGQYASASLVCTAPNTYHLSGHLICF